MGMSRTVAVISDTHMPRRGSVLPPACLALIAGADLLIHAGDVSDGTSLAYLEALGPPLLAVHGNVDDDEVRRHLPAVRIVEIGPTVIGVTHDAGPADGRLARLRRRFPDCRAVVFGHSHIPLHQIAADGFRIVNPGSPTDRRRQPRHSMALLELDEHGIRAVRFHAVDEPPGELDGGLIVT